MLHTLEMAHFILDALPVGVFWKDKNSVYLGCNQWVAEHTGVSTHDIIGKTDYDLCWAEYAPKYIHDDQEVIKNNEQFECIEDCVTIYDGSKISGKATKVPLVVNGEVIGVLGFWQDLSEACDILDTLSKALGKASAKTGEIGQKLDNYSRKIFEDSQNKNCEIFDQRQDEDNIIFAQRQNEDKNKFETDKILHQEEDTKSLKGRQEEDTKSLKGRQEEDTKSLENRQKDD